MDDILYKEMILDLYRNPLHKKELADFDIEKTGHNPSCGDTITLRIKFDDDTIADIGWTGEGCAISQAAISLITDDAKNKAKTEVESISKDDMLAMLGIPISHTRLKCALLGWQTIKDSLTQVSPPYEGGK